MPVAHCEFNPIEEIWAYVKNMVAKKNKTFNVKDVKKLFKDTMNNLPPFLWPKRVKSAKNFEDMFRRPSNANLTESLVINLDGEENEAEDSSGDSEEDIDKIYEHNREYDGTSEI